MYDAGWKGPQAVPPPEEEKTHVLPVSALRVADSPRLNGEDPEHVELLAQVPAQLPPVLVHRASMRVIDGMHRLKAAQLKGEQTIAVRFFDGDEDEAFVAAVAANQAHGLPLTVADREAAAQRIIATRPQTSDRSIAGITGLAPRSVAALRERVDTGERHETRVGRDGRVRPLNGATGRILASELIARRPGASLRAIAAAAGISPATVRDVRERLRRGEDPVPEGQRTGPGTGRAPAGEPARTRTVVEFSGRDRQDLLATLKRDPSLRFSASGRRVLHWLFARANGTEGWTEIADDIPPHGSYLVIELARACAAEWCALATVLEQRLESIS
jgi:hypothetical protein